MTDESQHTEWRFGNTALPIVWSGWTVHRCLRSEVQSGQVLIVYNHHKPTLLTAALCSVRVRHNNDGEGGRSSGALIWRRFPCLALCTADSNFGSEGIISVPELVNKVASILNRKFRQVSRTEKG